MNLFKNLVLALFSVSLIFSCTSDDNDVDVEADVNTNENGSGNINVIVDSNLNQEDIDALLFMLEEEKLARDTYTFLYDTWSQNIFSNIANSEQSHMNAIKTLLDANNVTYTILSQGQFNDQDLQDLYDQFEADGQISNAQALIIGATIEDLDIYDLERFINEASSNSLIDVFQSLQCGSRNHLRSFNSRLQNFNTTYTPQFISEEQFNAIINSSNEQCN